MKKLVLATLLIFLSPLIKAQQVTVTDCKLTTSIGEMDAFQIFVPKCDADDFEKAMEKWLKKHGGDVSNKKGETKTINVLFKEFYQTPVIIYTKTEASGENLRLKVSVYAGVGLPAISLQADLYQKFKDIFKAFCVEQAKAAAQARLDDAQKQLTILNSDMSKLKKDNASLQKEIDDYNASIDKDKKAIISNNSNQDKKASDIKGQGQKVIDLQTELSGIY
jgi:hypothetical protein